MNPFAEDEDASIPLKSNPYSNYTDSDDAPSLMDDPSKDASDDHYGTFNAEVRPNKTIQIKKSPILRPNTSNKSSNPIRTDKVTGNQYLRLRSVPMDEDAPNVLNYEKEVYNSMNMFHIAPRNESLHNIWLDHQSQVRNRKQFDARSVGSSVSLKSMQNRASRFKNKDVSEEVLHGYEWLGRSSSWGETLNKVGTRGYEAIALVLLALLVTVVAFIISQMTSFCWGVIDYVYTNTMYNEILIFLGCLVLKCGFVFAAIFFTVTTPQTAGSGIPELKAILSGIWIRRYLSIRGFFIKSLALVCALGSGLPIGIEGPVIHISAIIGRQLTKISMFKHIDRKMLLSAACACGIAVIFSAPIGGVLFSIEVTHHYYKIDSYWSAFLCATFAALFTTVVNAIAPTTLQLLHTSFTQEPYQTYEFIIFIILGAISGFGGASYVQLHKYFTLLRPKIARYHNGFWNNSYVLAGIVTSTYVLCAFILGEFAFQPSRMAISDLFNAQSLKECSDPVNDCNFTDWGQGLGVYWNLFCFSVLNYLFSIWFLVLDWPCGCFASVFAIGAATGRLMGEILNETVMDWSNTKLLAATYAVVGAASLVGGVTRTFSVAVIVIEMTLSVELSVPVLLGVIISWTIASWLSDGLYDSILMLRGIPLLPITPKHPTNWSAKPVRPFIASDLMVDIKEYGYLNDKSSFKEVALMLHHSNEIFFPVLSMHTRTLLGEVSRQILEEELKSFGYGKGTVKRDKLLQDATKRLQHLQTVSMRLQHFKMEERRLKGCGDMMDTDERQQDSSNNPHYTSLLGNKEQALEDEGHRPKNGFVQVQTPSPMAPSPDREDENESDISDHDQQPSSGSDDERISRRKPSQSLRKRKSRKQSKQSVSPEAADSQSHHKQKKVWDEDGFLKRRKEKNEWIQFHETKWIQHMNISPVTVIPTMPISQIYVLFHVLHPDKIYVAKRNELVGVIDEQILLERERLERKGGNVDTQSTRSGPADVEYQNIAPLNV